MTYRPDLDGLRAVAIGLVLLDHAGLPNSFGAAGVTAFFVLSGYLITGVLLRGEGLRVFYRRRIRRLAPAFLVMLAVVGTLGIAGAWPEFWRGKWLASVFYVTNWPLAFDASRVGPTDHAWSLAIEEQFYLSWPLLVVFARRRLVLVAIVGIAVGLAVRFGSSEAFGYYSTIGRMDGLLLGCLAALTRLRVPNVVGWAGLAFVAVAAVSPLPLAATTTLAEFGALGMVIARLPIGALAPIGKRAYSLYLWNTPCVLLFGVAGVGLAVVVAELSYRFVERPFLRHHEAVGEHRDEVEVAWREGLGVGRVHPQVVGAGRSE